MAIVVSPQTTAAQFIPTSLSPPSGMKRSLSVTELSAPGLKASEALVKAAIASLTRVIPACYAPDRTSSMRRFLAIIWVVSLGATSAAAQGSSTDDSTTAGARHGAATAEEEAISEGEEASPEPSREEDLPPQLRAPSMEGLQSPTAPAAPAADDSLDEEFDEDFSEEDFGDDEDMAADDAKLLGLAEPPASDPTLASWTNPRPVFSLNGYFRVRGQLLGPPDSARPIERGPLRPMDSGRQRGQLWGQRSASPGRL
jgi:hypothetical protein